MADQIADDDQQQPSCVKKRRISISVVFEKKKEFLPNIKWKASLHLNSKLLKYLEE